MPAQTPTPGIPPAPLNSDGSRGFGNGDSAYYLHRVIIGAIHMPGLADDVQGLLQALNALAIVARADDFEAAADALDDLAARATEKRRNRARAALAVKRQPAPKVRPFRVINGGAGNQPGGAQ